MKKSRETLWLGVNIRDLGFMGSLVGMKCELICAAAEGMPTIPLSSENYCP